MKILLVLTFLLIFTPLKSELYNANYKMHKNQFDSLTVFEPFVIIELNNRKEYTLDTALIKINSDIIKFQTDDVLYKKYKLNASNSLSINERSLDSICYLLDTKKLKSLDNISTTSIIEANDSTKRNYALLIQYYGNYNSNFDANVRMMGQMGSMSDGVIRISLGSPIKSKSIMRLFVFDLKNENILYYNSRYSGTVDPRQSPLIEKAIRTLLKPIYYK